MTQRAGDLAATWAQSPQDFEEVLRLAGDAITVQSPDGALVYANQAAARQMGFDDPDELTKQPLPEVMAKFRLLGADGEPMPVERLPGRRAMLGEPNPVEVIRFRRVDVASDDHWSLVHATPVYRDGRLHAVINVFQDITDLKRRELELATLSRVGELVGQSTDYQTTLRNLAEVVIPDLADWCVVDVFEPAGGINRVAVAHLDPAKLRMVEELQEKYPADPAAPSAIQTVMQTGEPVLYPEISDEMIAQAAQDEEHLRRLAELGLRSAAVLPLAARGEVLGVMTLIEAESAHRYSEADLPLLMDLARRAGVVIDNARLLHETNEAIRMRDDFLATASHDMRTPIATILAYVQLARRQRPGGDPARLDGYLERAERTTVRLARLVSELMDVCLIRAGQALPLAVEAVDLVALVEGAAHEHRPLVPSHSIVVEHGGEPITVETDPARIERILDNLLSNAVKYSTEGSTVTLRVEREGDGACISVTDTGVGIPADELRTIFEPFRRASTAGGAPGVGLGLAGARQVGHQLGGRLEAVSEPGKGSTFIVHLPPAAPAGRLDPAELS
jgi:PAS domain S-box-containing protein